MFARQYGSECAEFSARTDNVFPPTDHGSDDEKSRADRGAGRRLVSRRERSGGSHRRTVIDEDSTVTDDVVPDADPDAEAAATRPRIEVHPTLEGLRLVDPIENSEFTLLTPGSVDPTETETDAFRYPVDTAATVSVTELETPYLVDIWIRDVEGNLVTQYTKSDAAFVPPGEYNLEVASARMKLYLAVDGGVSVETRGDRATISMIDTGSVTVGIRSRHDRPAATVTTTDRPRDLMRAISTFGSALKTTTCERSFPTLRGYPPLLERGDYLDVPDSLDSPDTGIRIEVPPEREYVYPVVSLAHYLGAQVVPGDRPRLVVDGDAFSLTTDGDFETTVARVLKQTFVLDCVTRTEGLYDINLYERELVEPRLDLDFDRLYELPVAEQVRTYLGVPYETIADAVPGWKLVADVVPEPQYAETLPFVANDLAVVRCPDCAEIESRSIHAEEVTVADLFGDGGQSGTTQKGTPQEPTRSEALGEENPFDERVFRPPPADSTEQTYVGKGIPLGASKMTAEAYQRRLEYESSGEARTSVVVVCNESEMSDENDVSDIYGAREWLEFDITIRENLTTEEMAAVLRTEADLLHYIGHVDPEGIRCADGWLDANAIDEVGVTSFFLNACKSYEQGRAIVEAGALGGIVTVSDVLDRTAGKLGKTIAKLLNTGFSLASGREILERESITANQYLIVGDGNATIVENEGGTPILIDIHSLSDEECELTLHGYPSRQYPLGSLFRPYFGERRMPYLNSGTLDRFVGDRDDLEEYLSMSNYPVAFDGSLYWKETFDVGKFTDRRC